MNWPVLIITGLFLTALVLFLIRRNMKDEEEFEEHIKEDYHKPKNEVDDAEIDNVLK